MTGTMTGTQHLTLEAGGRADIAADIAAGIAAAESYLMIGGLSRLGLIQQVRLEGFPADVATEAVDALQPDWMTQASVAAERFQGLARHTRSAMLRRLVGVGFTEAQAEYATSHLGL